MNVGEHLGSDTFIHVNVDGLGMMTARGDGEVSVRHGDTVYLTPQPSKMHRFGPEGTAL